MQRRIGGVRGARDAAILLTVVAAFVVSSPSRAALIAEERFLTDATPTGPEFALGTVIGQNPGNPGFTGPWYASNGSAMDVVGTSLSSGGTNYPPSAGGSLFSPSDGVRVHRLLGPSNPFESTDSGTVYLSFYFQNNSLDGSNHYLSFEMHNGGNSDANRTFQIGADQGAPDFELNTNYGFRVNGQTSLRGNLGAKNTSVNLFLAKFNLSTSSNADSVTVWQNPTISTLVSDPSGGVTRSGFNFIADRLGVARFISPSSFDFTFDELRIGTTLEDVLTEFLACDLNGNGVCNSTDLAIISGNLFQPGAYADGDIDGNGVVDQADFRIFKDHSQRVVGFDAPGAGGLARSAIPEPAGSALLGLAIIAFAGGRRLRRSRGIRVVAVLVVLAATMWSAPAALAADIDLLNDTLNFSGKAITLQPYATTPGGFANIIQMTHRPSDSRMYVATEQGSIFVVNDDGNGNTSSALWFNAASALQTATGRSMHFISSQQGLQSVAFHPQFEQVGQPGYGKLYTTMLENRPADPGSPSHFYLGNSTYGGPFSINDVPYNVDGVLAEWTFDHNSGQVTSGSYRELFRVNMPNYDHPIKLAQFNPSSGPGDEDYGLLYVTHGDSNNQDSLNDDPQDRGDVMGKMLRIDPLQSGANRYTIPGSNPFFSGSSAPSPAGTPVLGEVYAYGFRNPHNFSFNEDAEGDTHIFVGDIGRSNMEEINLAVAGGNYGWPKREGTFVHLQGNTYVPPSPNAGYINGVSPLPGPGPEPDFIYPVAQYDHNGASVAVGADFTASAVASGFVVNNGSDPVLDDQFIFHNFAFNHGHVYHTDFADMLAADTEFETVDGPDELTQATLQRLQLELDHDSNPATPTQKSDNLNSLMGTFRNDGRYGRGLDGEMYISNKQGQIFLVTNTVPALRLTVDRATGEMSITNPTRGDVEIDSLALASPSNSLAPGGFDSLDGGWTLAPGNNTMMLGQSTAGSFVLTGETTGGLGSAYDAQLTGFGQTPGEDVAFQYTVEGGGTRTGYVTYTGESAVTNTIVLTVDVVSGQASLLNQTQFAVEVDLYTVSSEEGSLNAAGWLSLDAQGIEGGDWIASPADVTRLTEIQEDGTTTFDDATPFDLGTIYTTGLAQDLRIEFLLDGEDALREGEVEYILAGDYNDDGTVDAVDYTVWRNNLATQSRLANDLTPGEVTAEDYDLWKQNYGTSLPGAGSGGLAASVPEPATWLLLLIATAGLRFRHWA
jgi:hypothetical protein